MKIVLIVIGSLLGVYAAAGVVRFTYKLFTADLAIELAVPKLAATILVVGLPAALSFFCFQYAFRKRKPSANEHETQKS